MNPRYLIDFNPAECAKLETDFLIVGSGVAGLSAAIEASHYGKVAIITKDLLREGSTWRAQGGIAVALSRKDTPGIHLTDTIRTGGGLCNRKAVKLLVEEGIPQVRKLISWGANFDKEKGRLSFTQEAAHSKRRILHAGGDATGEEIENTLLRETRRIKKISFLEHTFVLDVITAGGVCLGALVLHNKRPAIIMCRAVVLAAGGVGQIFKNTTNPAISTGDGLAIAYRAGCILQDLEFIQFHPTVLYLPDGFRFLISESVRGEGGILRNARGQAFMRGKHKMGDLAPRDVVARAIFSQLEPGKAKNVFLDIRHLSPKLIKKRFPTIDKTCRDNGLDITRDMIPVRPAAHFMMGGIKTNLWGETNIEGILCCGETASTGVHGANRLASNSLLEGLVFGKRVGERARGYKKPPGKPIRRYSYKRQARKGVNVRRIRDRLRRLMEERAGIVRCGKSLGEAARTLKELRPILGMRFTREADFELQNMLTISELVVKSALKRKESRGAHYRSDYPQRDDRRWKRHSLVHR